MGTPNSVIQPLQKIQTFAPRLVLLASRHHHSTPLLEKLHWLPISERFKLKVACMCFSAINGSGPAYLSELLHVYTPLCWKSSNTNARLMPLALFLALDPTFGIHSHKTLLRHRSTLSSFKAKLKIFLTHSISAPTNINTQFLLQSLCECACVPNCTCPMVLF